MTLNGLCLLSPCAAASEIITFPNDTNVLEGANAVLVCSATSEPTHTVQWLKDGVQLSLTEKYSLSSNSGTDEREVVSTLVVINATMYDTGNYTCQVSNIHGSQSATAHLEVQSKLLNILDIILSISAYMDYVVNHS